MPISAPASNAVEALISGWRLLPMPTGTPSTRTTKTPPSVSPAALAASIAAIIRLVVAPVGIADVARLNVGLDPIVELGETDLADAVHVAARRDAERFEKLRANRAETDAHRGFARARALEHVAQIALAVFQRAGDNRRDRGAGW